MISTCPVPRSTGGSTVGYRYIDGGALGSHLAGRPDLTSNNSTGPSFRNSFQLVLIDRSDRRRRLRRRIQLRLSSHDAAMCSRALRHGRPPDLDGNPYDEYYYTVASTPLSRITMCWPAVSEQCGVHAAAPPRHARQSRDVALMAAGLGALFLSARRRRA